MYFCVSCAGNSLKNSPPTKYDTLNMKQMINDDKNLVAPGFVFTLSHSSDDQIKGDFQIDFQGKLKLPYDVTINTLGMSFDELTETVTKEYSKFYRPINNTISFKLKLERYFIEVRGLVKKPQRILVEKNENLDNILAMCDGVNGDLKKDDFLASIKQNGRYYSISLRDYFQNKYFSQQFNWVGGDVIFIKHLGPESTILPMVNIMGAIKKPGKYIYKEKISFYDYLQIAGGIEPDIDYNQTFLIRQSSDLTQKIQFNLLDVNEVPKIYPGDILILTSNSKSNVDTILNRSSQIAAIVSSIALVLISI